jgi:MFS family permease
MSGANATRQLRLLFISSVLVLFVGLGLFPVLPLYAASLGASRAAIGLFFALMYAANAAGPLAANGLSPRIGPRRLYLLTVLLSLPALALSGQVTALWQLMLLTAFVWFSGGVLITLGSVWTGMLAPRKRRGASFSFISLSNPIGAVFGGLAVGALLQWYGYSVLFPALAVAWAGLLVVGLALREPAAALSPRRAGGRAGRTPARLGRSFAWLLGLTLLSTLAIGMTQLGRSFSMQTLHFPPSAVASTATVGGLAAIPATLLLGNLADRLGRARLMAGSIALSGIAAVILMNGTALWHFWLAGALSLTAQAAGGALRSALGADLLAPESIARGLPLINLAGAIAAAVSYAATGLAMETLGAPATYLLAAVLAGVAFLQFQRLSPQAGNAGTEMAREAPIQTAPMSC